MLDTIYCHIGAGKTGTSSIQGTFFKNRDILEKHGIFNFRRPSLIVLADIVADPQRLAPVHLRGLDQTRLNEIIAEGARMIHKGVNAPAMRTGVFSTEHCLGLKQRDVAELKSRFDGWAKSSKVVYYARHPYSKIPSSLNQWTKTGQARLDADALLYLRAFTRELEPWIAVFGRENVIVRKFEIEAMARNSPVADFCETIGHAGMFDELEVTRSNEAISAPAALLAHQLNVACKEDGVKRASYEFLTRIAGRKFTLDPERIMRIDDTIQAELAFLRDTFGVDLQTPAFPEHVEDRNVLFNDEVLRSIVLIMNEQQQENDRLSAEVKRLRRKKRKA